MPLTEIEKRLKRYWKESRGDYLPPWLKKTLVVGIVVGLAVIAAGITFIFYYVNEPKGVDVEVSAPTDVSRGVPFELDINITNVSGEPLRSTSANIGLPDNLLLWGPTTTSPIYSESVGDVGVGSLLRKSYKIVAVGSLNSSQTVNVSFVYFNQSGSRFEVKRSVEVLIDGSAVNLSIVKPDQILQGSLFPFTVNYANNSDFDFPNMVLEADFPSSFQFDSSSIPPSSLNNTFALGSLLASSTGTISLKGEFSGTESSSFDIPIKLFAVLNNKNYEVADYDALFSLSPAPIGLSIFVNGSSNYIAKPVDTLNYSIQYSNASGIALKDVTVKAVLSGFADWSSVKTDGNFNPTTRTVVWSSANDPALQFVDPGASGALTISLNVNSQAPTSLQGLANKNLYVKVDASVSSPSVPYYVSGNQTFAEISEKTKIASLIYLSAKAYFNDPTSGFANAGSLPPKVGSATDYTIHWLMSNFGNDLSDVKISALLPAGVTFTGVTKSNIASSTPTFDPSTNGVIWNIGDVVANSGFLTGPIEGTFQIQATPDQSMAGNPEQLLGVTTLQATDNFTGGGVNASSGYLTTDSLSDEGLLVNAGVVMQ